MSDRLADARKKYIERCVADASEVWSALVLRGGCESPIEQLFLSEAITRSWTTDDQWKWHQANEAFGARVDRSSGARWKLLLTGEAGEMVTQMPVRIGGRGLRLDFAFRVVHVRLDDTTTTHWVAVELDGHDYHERTKEQAKRDRSRDRLLLAAGWRVLRFTGSEIHASVSRCWDELEDVLYGLYLGREGTP